MSSGGDRDGECELVRATGWRREDPGEAEFVAVLDDLLAALSKHGVGELEKAEVLALNYALEDETVHV
jgi:hypothetical protein